MILRFFPSLIFSFQISISNGFIWAESIKWSGQKKYEIKSIHVSILFLSLIFCLFVLFIFFLAFIVYLCCRSSECDVVRGECTQTYVPYLFLVIPLGPVTLTGQDYVLVESGCVCKPKYATDTAESKVTP